MAATYEPIATTTLGSGADTINFTSIASSWTDLRVTFVGKSQPTNTRYPAIRFNADTTALYSNTRVYGDGTSALSSRNTDLTYIPIISSGMDDTTPVFFSIDIFSYAGATYKTCLITSSENKNGSGMTISRVGLYRSTSAITQVNLVGASGSGIFGTGCTATLYGIKAA